MLRLRTLGGLSIENAVSTHGAAAHRRPLALLALLAVAGRKGLSRDKIMALLWPESDADHGRNSLSQAISFLRRELSADDVLLGSTELRINTSVLACDVIDFEGRIAADDLEGAVALYTGPFLDGVFLRNAAEFERWADRERARLERVQGDALERLAGRATASGDHVSAVRWWRQRADLASSDSRAALRLMESLVASGDPAGALEHYRTHQALLRDELGLEPDATHAEFAAAIRGRIRRPAGVPSDPDLHAPASADLPDGMRDQARGDMVSRPHPAAIAPLGGIVPSRARWFAAAVVILTLITAVLAWQTRTDRDARLSQLEYLLPDGMALHGTGTALSPDGTTIVYATISEETPATPRQLYVRRLDELEARRLPNTEGATYPFFSPDGRAVGFIAGGKLKTVSLSDGAQRVIADNLNQGFDEGADATWDADGSILFGEDSDSPTLGIRRVSARGGPVRVLSRPDKANRDVAHFAPQRLPGTETFIYTVRSTGAPGLRFRVVAQQLNGAASRTLIEGARRARYIQGGWLAYQIGTDVFVSRFDVHTLSLSEQRRVLQGVFPFARAQAWAATADVFIYHPELDARRALVWVSRDGSSEPLPVPPDYYKKPVLSPSGDRFAVLVEDATLLRDIWTYDLKRSVLTKISSDGISGNAMWSPDGARLVYRRFNGSALDIYTRAANGTGSPELLFGDGGLFWPADWTRDKRTLVVMRHDSATNGGDLWTLDVRSKTLRPLVRSSAQEWGGRLSPDGRWLAYFSDVSGRYELYVTTFPDASERWKVSTDGAYEAVWSRDGRELFFRSGKALLVTTVRPGATFDWTPPRVLFKGRYWGDGPGEANYDVSPDGKRFLMVQEAPRRAPRLNVIQGWQRLGVASDASNR